MLQGCITGPDHTTLTVYSMRITAVQDQDMETEQIELSPIQERKRPGSGKAIWKNTSYMLLLLCFSERLKRTKMYFLSS